MGSRQLSDAANDVLNRFILHSRVDGKADIFTEKLFRHRALPGFVPKCPVGSSKVDGHVMRPGLDLFGCIELPHEVFFTAAKLGLNQHSVDVEDMLQLWRNTGQPQPLYS